MPKLPKYIRNTGKTWSPADEKQSRRWQNRTHQPGDGLKLGRTEAAVRSKAASKGVSLKPTNRRPYNRTKK